MAISAQINFIVPFIIIILLFFAIIIILYLKRKRKQSDQNILAAFGRIPSVDNQDTDTPSAYQKYAANAFPDALYVDDITWNDLDMDAVFRRINVCSSSVGEEYLYHLLHKMEKKPISLEKREQLLKWLIENPSKRIVLQKILSGIGKRQNNCLSFYLFHADAKKLRFAWIYIVMGFLPILGLALMSISIAAGAILTLCAVGINIVIYYIQRLTIETELESMHYFSSLIYGAKSLDKHLGADLKPMGFCFAPALKPFQYSGGLVPGQTQQSFAELEILTILAKAIFLVDLILYNHIIRLMSMHKQEFHLLFQLVGEIDSAVSIASYRHSLKHYCLPEFQEDNSILFSEIFHPLLSSPITNSARIENDSIVTGSNASGKSTFIKSIAINNILAQTIYTCCAKQYTLAFSYVATSMALRDNVLSGDSYFITEIKSLKRILEYCKKQPCVCFIDEILRGTNTPERIAAGASVLKWLHKTGSLCIVASHDIELTEILGSLYTNYHFSEIFKEDSILFDYRLKNGVSKSTNAIKLLEYMAFDQEIVQEAALLIKNGSHIAGNLDHKESS